MISDNDKTTIKKIEYDNKIRMIYLISAISGIIAVLIIRRNLGAEYHLLKLMGLFPNGPEVLPAEPKAWFILFDKNIFLGLLLLDFFDVVNVLLVNFIILSLYFILKNNNKGIIAVSLLLSIISTSLYISNDISFSMLSLSKRYFLIHPKEELNQLISAGYALLSKHDPNTMYGSISSYFGLLFFYLSGLLASIAMIKSKIFKKISVIFGLLANSIGLLYFFIIFINKELIFIPITLAAPFTIIWQAIIAIKMIGIFNKTKSMNQTG